MGEVRSGPSGTWREGWLREYQAHLGWSHFKDYLYRDSQLLTAETAQGVRSYFHLDHLGTVRAITNASGQRQTYHLYFPYGQELTAFNQDIERMKFTGHERDLASLAGPGDDLDYMHARHYGPVVGRFLSFDPVGGNPQAPQSWNRYGYVQGNPLKYIDPHGLLRQPPAAGMPLENYYVGEGITVSSRQASTVFVDASTSLLLSRVQIGAALNSEIGRESRLKLSDFSVARSVYLLGQGGAAFVDGVVPFWDPFENAGMLNTEEPGVEESKLVGEVTRDIEITLATSGSQFLFRKGAWLNRGRYLRIGHSTHGKYKHFSLRGQWVDRLKGTKNAHIDLWVIGGR